MNIISSPVIYANQFWVATRFLEAVTLVVGFSFLRRNKKLNADLIFICYFIITLLITLSILVWRIFPICFIEGVGQTPFKVYAEYTIIAILLFAGYQLFRYKHSFSRPVYKMLFLSLIFTILSEFCFTLYVSNYSASNEFGHYFKLIAFFLIYKVNVETGFSKPTGLIFKNLKDDEEKYRTLAENLKSAEQQLKELNATKDKLFSIIAHDLKNPFTSLLSFSELIYKNFDKLGKDKVQNIALRMNESAKQAYLLLENLLNWSRVQTGVLKPNLKLTDTSHLLEEVKLTSDPLAKAKHINIEIQATAKRQVYTDQQMVNTVLRNLISNAIKFSYHNSCIVVKTEETPDYILFSIADSGIGIEKENQEQLLKIESRVTTTGTDAEKGTGLGLVLCKEFVEICGGNIWLESEFGIGTTFYFTLPFEDNFVLKYSGNEKAAS